LFDKEGDSVGDPAERFDEHHVRLRGGTGDVAEDA
jgi:hypothetical protein